MNPLMLFVKILISGWSFLFSNLFQTFRHSFFGFRSKFFWFFQFLSNSRLLFFFCLSLSKILWLSLSLSERNFSFFIDWIINWCISNSILKLNGFIIIFNWSILWVIWIRDRIGFIGKIIFIEKINLFFLTLRQFNCFNNIFESHSP